MLSLRFWREYRGVSVATLLAQMNTAGLCVSRRTIYRWEAGDPAHLSMIREIARILLVTPEELIQEPPKKEHANQ
jgi:transcriptional regulator with XRE-family HTH domain